jgi:hypothetical protein
MNREVESLKKEILFTINLLLQIKPDLNTINIKLMSESNKKLIGEKEIIILTEKSLKEVENFLELEIVKKKYLEKGGLVSQFFQQISQEEDPEKKKKLGSLINN